MGILEIVAGDRVTYVGHATALLELGATRVLTDPVMRQRLLHLRRLGPPAVRIDPVDVVLISHAHLDHLDLPSLRALGTRCPVVVPRGCGRRLQRLGFGEVHELTPGQRTSVAGLDVLATGAVHNGRRHPFAPRSPALGYVVTAPSARVYFAGDTDLFAGMSALANEQLDLALLPVAGWGTYMGPGHMDPERAARAAAMVGARMAVPIHWGTLASPAMRRRGGDPAVPAREFERFASQLAPDVDVRVLFPGESAELR